VGGTRSWWDATCSEAVAVRQHISDWSRSDASFGTDEFTVLPEGTQLLTYTYRRTRRGEKKREMWH